MNMKHLIITLTVMMLFSSCGGKIKESPKESAAPHNNITLTEAQYKNAAVTTVQIEAKSISYILKVNGKIDVPPQNIVSISAQLGGYLKTSQLLPGMKVKKGEVIAVMEDQQYIQLQQDYLISKAKLLFLEKEFNRQKELNENKASSDKQFQQTEADFSSQRITLKALYEKLKLIGISPESLNETNISRNISIHAPIDGYVSSVNVNIGKYVNPSEVLFELVNPTDIHLNLKVYEKDVNKLFIGQKVMAYSNSESDKKYPCEIILIGQNLSPERSVEVHCHFEDYDKKLIPGMYMNGEIEVKSNNALVAPEEAIVNFEGKNYIFIDKGNYSFEMREVETGNTENKLTELINAEALKGKNIVSNGAYSLLMSLKNTEE